LRLPGEVVNLPEEILILLAEAVRMPEEAIVLLKRGCLK
jgi:hypothetical protein